MTTTTATICKKIDIHSHILFGVDHGSYSIQNSIEALKEAKKNKITDIICTPHYSYTNDNFVKNFDILKEEAKKLNITLHKGHEIPLNPSTIVEIKSKRARALNRSKYLLLELKRNNSYSKEEISDMVTELIDEGFKIIFAHPELIRKTFVKKKDLDFYRNLGVLFQVDADSFYRGFKKQVKKLLKANMVHFVASDYHYDRNSFYHFTKFQNYVIKKYGRTYAEDIFYNNQKKLLQNKTITN